MRVVLYQDSNLDPNDIQSGLTDHLYPLLDQVYTELGKDAPRSSLQDYPALRQLLADHHSQPIDYVVLGDLFPVQGELDRVSHLQGQGLPILNCPRFDSQIPLENKTQVLVWHLLDQIAQQQRAAKIRQGHAHNRLKALPPPGRAPYGYRRNPDRYSIDRSAAPVVKAFFEQFLLYGSLRGAVRYLAHRYGKKISTSTGQRWLTHPVYRGDLSYGGGEVIRNTHPALISRDEAAQVDRLLRRNRNLAPRTASAQRSLSGLVFCALCGSATRIIQAQGRGQAKTYRYLRPLSCGRRDQGDVGCKSVPYDRVLDQVMFKICQTLPTAVAPLDQSLVDRRKAVLEQQIQEKAQVIEQLAPLAESGVLDGPTVQLRTRNLRRDMAQLQTELDQLPPVNLKELVQAVVIPQFWQDLSEPERRFFFREFIQSIRFNPEAPPDYDLQLRFVFQTSADR